MYLIAGESVSVSEEVKSSRRWCRAHHEESEVDEVHGTRCEWSSGGHYHKVLGVALQRIER